MELLSLSCNKCGAPLEVPHGTNFITCSYCGARLAIHASGGAAYTEVLESIDNKATQILDKVEAIEKQLARPKRKTRYETCEIGWAPGPRYGERPGTLVFVAEADGPGGRNVFFRSGPVKYDLHNIGRNLLIPKETEAAREAFTDLVERIIEDDGWDPVGYGDYWFSQKLRRVID